MNVHPIHAGRRMGVGAVSCCVGAIGLLILLIFLEVPVWGLLIMFGLAEAVVYKAFAATVRRRRRDVALLRCFGASRMQVFNGVLTEAAWLGLFGGVAGLVSVLVLLDVMHFDIAVFSVFVGSAGAVLAALVPAFRASRIPPSGPSTVS